MRCQVKRKIIGYNLQCALSESLEELMSVSDTRQVSHDVQHINIGYLVFQKIEKTAARRKPLPTAVLFLFLFQFKCARIKPIISTCTNASVRVSVQYYACFFNSLLHISETFDRFCKSFNRFICVTMFDTITHTVLNVPFQHNLSNLMKRRFGSVDL